MSYQKFQIYFFVAFLVLSIGLTLLVFRPYLTLLAFGGILAIIARPIYKFLKRWLRSETAASFLTVLLVTTTIVLPTVYFFAALAEELVSLIANVKSFFDGNSISGYLRDNLPASLHARIPEVMDEISGLLRTIVGKASSELVGLFSNVMSMLLGFIVVLICLYYLLKDGGRIKRHLLAISPLNDEYDELVLNKIIVAVGAVLNGVLIIGLIKGILASLAFWIFGIPAPLFWGAMTGLASFLPIVGAGLITGPAIIYLLIIGHYGAAIGLTVISVLLIGTIDNFLQPKLVESKTKIHPLLILLSILGGLEFYGFAGFILGPLTLAVSMALIDIYQKDFKNYIERSE